MAESRESRKHHIIQTTENQNIIKFHVNTECPDHCEQFNFYCPTHDSIACVVCVKLKHGTCKDLRPLDEVSKGAKTSTALTDLELTINGSLKNIEKGVLHIQQNITDLLEQEEVTKKSIATKRAEMNKHLDRLEEKLLKELKSESEKAVKAMSFMKYKFESKRKNILDLKDTTQSMKQFSTNVQVFIGIRRTLKTVVSEINGVKRLLSSIPKPIVSVQISPKFDTFTKAFDSLGKIQIASEKAVVPYVERRLNQAQFQRPAHAPVFNIDNLHLKLRTNIEMGETNSSVSSCLILPNKSIMIVSSNKSSLTILKEDGSHDRDISIPYRPYGVTIIDDQRVAVSHGLGEAYIYIVNIKTQNKNQTLKNLSERCIWGITYNGGKLYAVAPKEGIIVISLDGNIIKNIRIYNDAYSTYQVTTQEDKIYYSVNNGSVYCVDKDGTEIWTKQNDQLLYNAAIAVDNYDIAFVVGNKNNLLLAISPDGKQDKVLLTSSDGLKDPSAVYYDKDSKRLLVCNKQNGHAALYDVIY